MRNCARPSLVSSPSGDRRHAMLQVLIGIAALFGCAGIVFAAAGAHAKPGSGLDSAGHMLLFHAPAVIAACAGIAAGLISRPVGDRRRDCAADRGRAVFRRPRAARLCRTPAVSDGRAGRRHGHDRRMGAAGDIRLPGDALRNISVRPRGSGDPAFIFVPGSPLSRGQRDNHESFYSLEIRSKTPRENLCNDFPPRTSRNDGLPLRPGPHPCPRRCRTCSATTRKSS